jgi:hypothetical protein
LEALLVNPESVDVLHFMEGKLRWGACESVCEWVCVWERVSVYGPKIIWVFGEIFHKFHVIFLSFQSQERSVVRCGIYLCKRWKIFLEHLSG